MPYIQRHPAPEPSWRSDRVSELPCIRARCTVIDSDLGAWSELMPGCRVEATTLGDYSYCAGDVDVMHARIGRFCSIASHVRINPGNHPMERVTQHHCTYRRAQYGFAARDDADFFAWRAQHPVTIGHDVWIGHAAIIMPGVSIGTGAVIGAAAVVTRDVPDFAIVAGVPATFRRWRFEESIRTALLHSAWWEWGHATLHARFAELDDPVSFAARYGSERSTARPPT